MPRAVPVLVLGLVILGCSKRPPAIVVPPTSSESPASPPAGESEPEPLPIEPPASAAPAETPDEAPSGPEETPQPGGTIRTLDAAAPTLLGALGVQPRLFA